MSSLVIAPFTNGDIRDWPASSFVALIRLLLVRDPALVRVRVLGTSSQRVRACDIVREFDPGRVSNESGRLTWPDVIAAIRSADCVIGNNSGLTHLSAFHGVPTVCIFGGSHQRLEWRPMGFSATTLSRAIGCSPCNLHRTRDCPYDKACLREISPVAVYDAAVAAMARQSAGAPLERRGRLADDHPE